jgi:xylulokinase
MGLLLGIDLGTSGIKAVVFDLKGRPLGRGFAPTQYLDRPPGWAEQDPRSWWEGSCQAIKAALAEVGGAAGDVAGIGVCGFHHCPVFLDSHGEPVRPTIVTHDRRLGASLAELVASGALSRIEQVSGSKVVTGHFPSIFRYVRTRDPDTLPKTRWIVLAKDYIRYRLTGRLGTDLCDATGTHLVAMPDQVWSGDLCELVQVPREKLPQIGMSSKAFGAVTGDAARSTGLEAGTPVVYGGGDSHCALVGLGVTGSAEAGLLLGTNSTLRASFADLIKPLGHSVWVQQHVVPRRFTASASSMAGSSVLTWFKDTWAGQVLSGNEAEAYRELEAAAAGVPPGSEGLLFHPYVFGERSPFYSPGARGSFLGIAHWHGRGHFARSVMEGVAFAIANCLGALQEIAGTRGESIDTIRVGEGGGIRLGLWKQIICDVLELPLEVVSVEEPGCLGAALLAGVGVGAYSDLAAAVESTVRVSSEALPEAGNSGLYRKRRGLFNQAYRVLEPILYEEDDREDN